MIDWHSHILPNIDDGSRNISESISLINMQKSQKIDTVIATPHFIANDETVGEFLKRRNNSYEMLKAESSLPSVNIILGAEVKYYMGIGKLSSLESLKIGESNLLLLEMPMSSWSESTVRELTEMSSKGDIQIVLAHIERYFSLQSLNVWNQLLENEILMQVNASFFNSPTSRHRAISLLKKGYIHIIGSDCHNVYLRPPQIGKAYDVIQKKLGDDYLSQMNDFGYSILNCK